MKKHVPLLISFALILSTSIIAQVAPPPTTVFYVGNKPVDMKAGVALGDLPRLMLKVVPDSAFAAAHPNDIKYTAYWSLYVRRGNMLRPPQTGSTESLQGGILGTAKKGDAISIEIDRIIRTDANGKREKVELGPPLKYLSIYVE